MDDAVVVVDAGAAATGSVAMAPPEEDDDDDDDDDADGTREGMGAPGRMRRDRKMLALAAPLPVPATVGDPIIVTVP
jgi:hypothetical protein